MLLYHGTSKENLPSILDNGVTSPSYWGTLEQASEFSSAFGSQGIILCADIDESDLSASLLMAESLYENGDIDEIPDSSDIEFSLDFLGGVTCEIEIHDFNIA